MTILDPCAERTGREGSKPSSRCRRNGNERGAALVEFGLIAPVLFVLLFGIIDFGMAFNDWIAVRQGAREGARQAVTGRIGSNTACTIRAGSPSFPANSQVNELVCLAKSRVSLNQNRVAVNVKIEDDYNSKESLVVCVMYQLDSITGFYDLVLDNRVVRTSVQMKTEQTVNDATGNGKVLADWAETPLSGTDWSYCSVAQTVT